MGRGSTSGVIQVRGEQGPVAKGRGYCGVIGMEEGSDEGGLAFD